MLQMFLSIQWKSKGSKTFQSTVFFFCFFHGINFLPEFPPKNENSVIYSPSCCSKPICISFFFGTQKKKNVKMLESKQLQFPSTCVVYFCSMEIYENQWEPKLFAYQHSSKCLLLCSTEQSYTGLEQHEAYTTYTTWVNNRIFIFGWTVHLSRI